MLIIQPRVILIHSVIIREIVMVMIQQKSEARDKKRGGRWTAEGIYSTFGQKLPPSSHLKRIVYTSLHEVWDQANIRYFQSLHSNVIKNQIKLKQLFISHSSFALWWCGLDQIFSTIWILSANCPFGVGIGIRSDISTILHRKHLVYADVRSWPWLAVCNEYTRVLYINCMFCKDHWRSKKHSNCCALCRNQLVTESIKGINKLFERAPLRDNLIAPQRSLRDGSDCWFKSSIPFYHPYNNQNWCQVRKNVWLTIALRPIWVRFFLNQFSSSVNCKRIKTKPTKAKPSD